MKRIFTALCALLMLVSLASCAFEGYAEADLSAYLTLGEYKGLPYTIVDTTVTEDEVNEAIEDVRAEHMVKSEQPDRESVKGDYVVIDYTTSVQAGQIAALSAKDKTFAVGSTYTLKDIPGVSEFLIGKKMGESYTFTLTFPADYTNANISDVKLVAGKEATVEITIKSLYEYVKPELNDEFVQKVSETAKTVDEYKAQIRAELEESAQDEAKTAMQEEIWAAVLENATVKKYPKSEVTRLKEEMHQSYEEYAASYGYELEEFLSSAYGYSMETFEQKKQENAEGQVKNNLVLYSIARAEGIEVTDEEYTAGLKAYFDMMGEALGLKTIEDFEAYHTKEVIHESLLWDEVILFLCEAGMGETEETK